MHQIMALPAVVFAAMAAGRSNTVFRRTRDDNRLGILPEDETCILSSALAMILVAIGANLPDRKGRSPLYTCRAAVEALRALPGLRLDAVSGWWRTAAVPASEAPDYVNGVARMEGSAEPEWLLARLMEIEARAGRVRSVPNAPRTLDLDIIDLNGLVRDAPDPVLPHPRAHLRAFVLVPLAEVAPEWVHPRLATSVKSLIASLPPSTIAPL
jgi:2-amino-4-hydroxy-6-hydroxymethyldihydropteridine diphosphokinase